MKTVVRSRDLVILTAIAIAVACGLSLPGATNIDGIGLDILVALRHAVVGSRHQPDDSPVAIVAVDEESYRRQPLADRPIALWTPEIGRLVEALFDAGATVIGFDIVLPTSAESFAPGYERDFLRALHRGGASGRLVLGEVQQQEKPILPHRGQIIAAGSSNIRPLNITEDTDGVIRRVPLFLAGGSEPVAGFALELAGRFVGARPEPIGNGDARLGERIIRATGGGSLLVNFDGGGGGFPHYSFADLVACVDARRTDFLRNAFAGKVVLIGAVLDVEDRKLTSKRFATAPEGANDAPRCILPPLSGLYRADLGRAVVPGTEVQASAVRDILTEEWLRPLRPIGRFVVLLLAAMFAAAAGLVWRMRVAALAVVGAVAAFDGASLITLQRSIVMPALAVTVAGLLSYGFAVLWRTGIVERDRRALARAFRLYLPAAAVDRLLSSPKGPELGGEIRDVTVLFSDIADFTALAEKQNSHALVTALNGYFDRMAEIIEREGGFIDKFIGDAIVAVFGAPAGPLDHAAAAMRAACAMTASTQDLSFRTRVGLNSGPVLIGNIGASRRFNYTVMGDTVNLASRLEGANKEYGTTILASGDTRAAAQIIAFREVDRIRVVGRAAPIDIFTPLPGGADASRESNYAAALALYREGRFEAAADAFDSLNSDPIAATMAKRARAFAASPPPSWDGSTALTTK
jgi:adenylate cyclase